MKRRDPVEEDIIAAAEGVRALVDEEFAKCGGSPPAGSALDQGGLRDGKTIVIDHVDVGEAGHAFDHLTYMVKETGINVGPEIRQRIRRVAAAMKRDLAC